MAKKKIEANALKFNECYRCVGKTPGTPRAVICISGTVAGIAICDERDQFSKKVGREIAFNRMLVAYDVARSSGFKNVMSICVPAVCSIKKKILRDVCREKFLAMMRKKLPLTTLIEIQQCKRNYGDRGE